MKKERGTERHDHTDDSSLSVYGESEHDDVTESDTISVDIASPSVQVNDEDIKPHTDLSSIGLRDTTVIDVAPTPTVETETEFFQGGPVNNLPHKSNSISFDVAGTTIEADEIKDNEEPESSLIHSDPTGSIQIDTGASTEKPNLNEPSLLHSDPKDSYESETMKIAIFTF